MGSTVTRSQRFTHEHPCPICGGYESMGHGNPDRCWGFLSEDGLWAHCTHADNAGYLSMNAKSETYAHRLYGRCGCGDEHNPAHELSQSVFQPSASSKPIRIWPSIPQTWKVKGREGRDVTLGHTADYLYCDADGTLLYVVTRYGDQDVQGQHLKTFLQFRPVPHQKGWVATLKACPSIPGLEVSVEYVLYRLPELIAARQQWSDALIFIPEGEKCVEALRSLGIVATCNPGGALKWSRVPGASEALRGAHVVLLPDNDGPSKDHPHDGFKGQRHVCQVAQALNGVAQSIRILDLPGLGPKKDVYDWLKRGGTKEQLLALARSAPLASEWVPPWERATEHIEVTYQNRQHTGGSGASPDAEEDTQPTTMGHYPILTDLQAEALEPPQGILGDLLFDKSTAFLFGDSGTWKTFLALDWACHIATGREWLGRAVKQGPVIYVAGEGGHGLGQRITAWKQQHGIVGQGEERAIDLFVVPVAVNLLDRQAVPDLIADIRQHPNLAGRQPRLLIFDTLACCMSGGDENNARDSTLVFEAARQLKHAFGCCVLILHHHGKDTKRGMRGSSGWRNNADTAVRMVPGAPSESGLYQPGEAMKVTCAKPRDAESFADVFVTTEVVRWTRADGTERSSLVIVGTQSTASEEVEKPLSSQALRALQVLAESPESLSTTNWEKACGAQGVGHSTYYDVRKRLLARGLVEQFEHEYRPGEFITLYRPTSAGRGLVSPEVQGPTKTSPIGPNGPNGPGAMTHQSMGGGPTGHVDVLEAAEPATPEKSGAQAGPTSTAPIKEPGPLDLADTRQPVLVAAPDMLSEDEGEEMAEWEL